MGNFKNKKIYLALAVVVIFLVAVFFLTRDTSDSNLIVIDSQRLTQLLENEENAFVYIGTPGCPVCVEFEPILEATLESLEQEIYYFNIDEARAADEDQTFALLESLAIESVPTIIYLEAGQVRDKIVGILPTLQLTNFLSGIFAERVPDNEDELAESRLVVIGNQRLAEILEEEGRTFVYVGRPTCRFCLQLEPILEEVLTTLDQELYYFNIDEAQLEGGQKTTELLELLEIATVPTLLLLESGNIEEVLLGVQTAEQLKDFFE